MGDNELNHGTTITEMDTRFILSKLSTRTKCTDINYLKEKHITLEVCFARINEKLQFQNETHGISYHVIIHNQMRYLK